MSIEEHKLKFPVMLRKMWTGQEVQDWLDSQEHDNESLVLKIRELINALQSDMTCAMHALEGEALNNIINQLEKLIEESK
jgi:hypothetical protein